VGELHPRSLLAELGEQDEVYRKELCWREFYADVLWQRPASARESLDRRFDEIMPWDTGANAQAAFDAWATGRTGYPFVDAGMRQLRTHGWMHNRVRMVVASFLVKDLHLPWQRGAAEFMHWLRDGDLASNAHGWQWTAGCGTDASPFYRVFNPVAQGLKFDPQGTTCVATCQSSPTCPERPPMSRGSPLTATRTATRPGWSTTGSSARPHWPPSPA
jgi:deoxyribodipyrimidine photo-lyase